MVYPCLLWARALEKLRVGGPEVKGEQERQGIGESRALALVGPLEQDGAAVAELPAQGVLALER